MKDPVKTSPIKITIFVLLVAALSACGGGGGGGTPPPDPAASGNQWDSMEWDNGKWG